MPRPNEWNGRKCLNEWINEMEEKVLINDLTKWKKMSQWMNELISRKQIS